MSINIVVVNEELGNNLEASHRTIHHTLRVADSWTCTRLNPLDLEKASIRQTSDFK